MRGVRILGSVLLLVAGSACPNKTPDPNRLIVTGSSTIAPLMGEIAKQFESDHPGVRIDVQTGGSSRGIADVQNGLADVGMASRALTPEEAGLHAYTIARDGVAVIVHKDNPVGALTRENVLQIFTKNVRNWKDVGGKDAPISVVNKAEGRATLQVFTKYLGVMSSDIKADVIVGDNEHGIKTVVGNPNAIGYVSIGTAEYDAKRDVAVKMVSLDGVDASLANVYNKTWPISRPLNLVTREAAQGRALELIRYSRSPKAAEVFRQQYFVQLSAGTWNYERAN